MKLNNHVYGCAVQGSIPFTFSALRILTLFLFSGVAFGFAEVIMGIQGKSSALEVAQALDL